MSSKSEADQLAELFGDFDNDDYGDTEAPTTVEEQSEQGAEPGEGVAPEAPQPTPVNVAAKGRGKGGRAAAKKAKPASRRAEQAHASNLRPLSRCTGRRKPRLSEDYEDQPFKKAKPEEQAASKHRKGAKKRVGTVWGGGLRWGGKGQQL